MNQYPNAASGLKKIFMGQILAIVSVVLMVIPILNIVGIILLIACCVLDLIGINEAAKDSDGYGKALSFTIANIVISIIEIFLDSESVLYQLLEIASSVCSLAILYYICTTTADLLRRKGAYQIADEGDRVWNINKICLIISVVCSALAIVPIINIIAVLALLAVALVSIYASIIYIIFLKKKQLN